MVLSNVSIQKALDSRLLVIDPEPTPRDTSQGPKCPYDTTAVDLRLGNEIVELCPQSPHTVIDLRNGGFKNMELLRLK
jgi:hypothetical protein